jgi:large subunit ribosomal protein L24e
VYPGKGRRFVTKSGQLVVLAGSKVRGLRQAGKKPAKLVWTQAWRRMHKKLNVESSARRRARKVVKTTIVRATIGMDKDQVRRPRSERAGRRLKSARV